MLLFKSCRCPCDTCTVQNISISTKTFCSWNYIIIIMWNRCSVSNNVDQIRYNSNLNTQNTKVDLFISLQKKYQKRLLTYPKILFSVARVWDHCILLLNSNFLYCNHTGMFSITEYTFIRFTFIIIQSLNRSVHE